MLDKINDIVGRTKVRMTGMRKAIAAKTTLAKQEVPHFYLSMDIEMDNLLARRCVCNIGRESSRLSINDYLIKAVSMALVTTPSANRVFDQGSLYTCDTIDISIAIAIKGGVITPVIRGTESLSVEEISVLVKELIEKARTGKLMPGDYTGGMFMLSNLGMYSIKNFTAIINSGQMGALAIGTCEQRMVVRGGSPEIAKFMTVTLSADHRSIDGSTGAEFLSRLKDIIESESSVLYR